MQTDGTITKMQAYELLHGKRIVFDYYRGKITYTIGETTYFVWPCKFVEVGWSEYPIYKEKDFQPVLEVA